MNDESMSGGEPPSPPEEEAVTPGDSADYLLRSLQTNHIQLSAIADQKASILVGATMVSLGVVAPLDPSDTSVALVILAVTAALAGGAGVLALLPRVKTTSERRNPLFFGVHSNLTSEEFHDAMAEILADKERIYDAIVEDVHQMGHVLSRKFRLINIAYAILIVGLATTLLGYLIDL